MQSPNESSFTKVTVEKNTEHLALSQPTDDSDTVTQGSPSVPHIQSLPDDLLLEIFSLALLNFTFMRELAIPLQYVLATVCRRWRELVLHAPLLWTDIYFPTNEPHDAGTFIFFERSKPALFDVTFSSVSSWSSADMELQTRVSNAIAKHVSRLRSLTIRVLGPQEVFPIFHAWKYLEASNLKNLDIHTLTDSAAIISSSSLEPQGDSELRFWRGGNALRSLKLGGFDFQGFPSLPNLTTLQLDRVELAPRGFRSLLIHCPLLENLVIHRFGAPYHPLEGHSEDLQVDAPSLRSLAINIETDHGDTCGCALPFLIMKNLEYLEVSNLWPTFTYHHASILTSWKNLPNLTILRIHSVSFWANNVSFLSALPSTVNLEIVGFPKFEYDTLIYILNLSNLHSISIDLSSPRVSKNTLDLEDIYEELFLYQEKPMLRCPVILQSENMEHAFKLKEIMGNHLTVQASPIRQGLLDDYLKKHFFEDDDDTLFDRLMAVDLSSDEFEEQNDYEYEVDHDFSDYESWDRHDDDFEEADDYLEEDIEYAEGFD